MLQQKIVTTLIATIFFCAMLCSTLAQASSFEIDMEGTATNVIDGDTYDVIASNGTQYRVRLADVNAPERDTTGYDEAKEYLTTLINGKRVYLDTDDIYTWDAHGTGNRIVCVTYVEYNSTHYLNVNEGLFEAGLVEKKEYDNEFNPYVWTLYELKQESFEFSSTTILAGIAVVLVVLAVFYLIRFRQRS